MEMVVIPWKFLDSTLVPGDSAELCLYARGTEFSIRVNGCELMNSRVHGSEDALAEFACARIGNRQSPRILIGGLGMGFTTAAALRLLDAESRVVVAELVPAVVEWNRKFLGELTGHPLQDPRVTVRESARREAGTRRRADHPKIGVDNRARIHNYYSP